MTVSFKTLDWIVRGQSAEVPVIYAGAFGIDRFYSVKGTPGNWTLSYPGADCMTHLDGFQTQSAARKAAQADYEARAIVPLIFPPPSTHVEPVAVIEFARSKPGNENEMPRVVSCNWQPDGVYAVHLAPSPHSNVVGSNDGYTNGLLTAAQLIELHVIKQTDKGKVLAPRQDGNLDGLHYAEEIRLLVRREGCE
ncbi:hypothetical protein SAMN05880590_10112 [Rhizobium sp. RU35A]|uniref:hypothetical protein n=1 Tax=Rhizobium sp. RU35A TaxID=1907414 RepID=UPI0009552E90|nr:hypothetical protein [Rhizobium sp. RU35A]SIP88951.1 hypothetical protein SAMN05880590_10112 [Rhizobium sp. RU35A]